GPYACISIFSQHGFGRPCHGGRLCEATQVIAGGRGRGSGSLIATFLHVRFRPPTAESLEQRLKHDAEATRIGLSTATRKASASLAEREGDEVVYVAAKLKDVVSSAAQLHGWNQPAVNVNIANIPMPTEEERAEMRALDAKLDAFAAMLKRRRVAGG